MNKTLSLNLEITPQDYENAAEFLKKRSFTRQYGFIVYPLITYVFFILLIFWMSNDISRMNIPATFLVSAIPALIMWVGILLIDVISPLPRTHSVKTLINYSPYMQGTTQMNFTDEGIEFLKELASTKMKWRAFSKVIESKSELFLYTSEKSCPIFIPKRAFNSNEDMNFIKYLITMRLADKSAFYLSIKNKK